MIATLGFRKEKSVFVIVFGEAMSGWLIAGLVRKVEKGLVKVKQYQCKLKGQE